MQKVLTKYSLSSLFALVCVIEFAIILNLGIPKEILYVCELMAYYIIPAILVICVGFINYNRYLKMNLWQIIKYILFSIVLYFFSLIVIFFFESYIDRIFHQVDGEDMVGAIIVMIVIAIFTVSMLISYMLPFLFSKRNIKGKLK
ncbi:hypothetical protein [Clostridium felsineum]|uniref:hypothetical protein n=1 Tax=Clostridium felsineum TaxID=36839 RepID=UPI00098CAF1F|nr:hypothetical protein [Clostridium felsineum]URZ00763.1 hypothetical protein CLAUR_007510 [Clostridium felsineum]